MTYIRAATQAAQKGFSLIELMVAMIIGLVLIFGATQVYVDSRNAYSTNEAVARMQETARYALSVLEPDIRMADYWGLLKGSSGISNQAPQTAAVSPVANWAGVTACGTNFAVDVNTSVQADDGQFLLTWSGVASPPASCLTMATTSTPAGVWTSSPMTSSDTITVRRAAIGTSASTNGWLQICSTRTQGAVYSNGAACNAASQQVNNLVVDAYYIDQNAGSQNTEKRNGLPSLRRKVLTSVAGSASYFADEEVIAGVEDMQVQFGIDPQGSTGIATVYVNPAGLQATLAANLNAQVVSVRLWLLVRADTPEPGFTDNTVYAYGDRSAANGVTGDLTAACAPCTTGNAPAYRPSASADNSFTSVKHYRRLLVSRTFQLRNALGT